MIFEVSLIFLLIIAIISFLYSSVGHGGASGYIALMTIFSFSLSEIRPTALILNIIVSGISFVLFNKYSHFRWNLFYPFAISSIPFSFIGGSIQLENNIYKVFLALLLIISIFRIIFLSEQKPKNILKNNFVISLLIGSIIGFFSGLIGIGGGIILSPIIIILNWGTMKQAAATSALFIFFNSISGFFGYYLNDGFIPFEKLIIIPFVIFGAIIGSFYGSNKLSNYVLSYFLVFVLFLASIKLLLL